MAYITDSIGTRHIITRRWADGVAVIRALDTPYTADAMTLVIVSVALAVPAAADSATVEGQVGTPLNTVTQARSLAAAGALGQEIDACIVFVVNPGEIYQVTSTLVATGTATLIDWHEMVFT